MAEETIHYPLPLISIVVPIFACFVIFLLLPPLVWHARNGNMGATALTFWLVVLNLINFLNALVWPRTNIPMWWHGAVYCDIELRLIIGSIIGGLPGGTLCISKALAKVLDTNRQIVVRDKKEQRRQNVMDGLLGFGLPVYFMVVYYVVHNGRYFIVSTYGCDTPMDRSWVTVVLLMMWPPVLLLASSYYAGPHT
jgi:pheromone a factor receptor